MIYVHTVTISHPDVGLHKNLGDPLKTVLSKYNISMICPAMLCQLNYLIPLLDCQRRVSYV